MEITDKEYQEIMQKIKEGQALNKEKYYTREPSITEFTQEEPLSMGVNAQCTSTPQN